LADWENQKNKAVADAKKAAPEAKPMRGTAQYAHLTLMPSVKFTLPLVMLVGAVWLAWRIVNMPAFADFLIATESELNKVSWTTRQRLVQDTIVVLVTMVLMAVFLFVVDIAWARLLSSRPIGVLRASDPTVTETKEKDLKW
jgi:preprotein translocase SecE subunit